MPHKLSLKHSFPNYALRAEENSCCQLARHEPGCSRPDCPALNRTDAAEVFCTPGWARNAMLHSSLTSAACSPFRMLAASTSSSVSSGQVSIVLANKASIGGIALRRHSTVQYKPSLGLDFFMLHADPHKTIRVNCTTYTFWTSCAADPRSYPS